MICIALVFNTMIVTYIDPTLEPYVSEEFGMKPSEVGMVFFAGSLVYMILCPVGGLL